MSFAAPRGTHDILQAEATRWEALEATFRLFCHRYGYGEIRTPIFENTALFTRSVGEETDIVSKQMYTFESKGGDSLTLRPEGTAPAVRAAVQHSLVGQGGLLKLFYYGPIFRYERPAKGRFRQFHQVGVEALGSPGPEIDAETIAFGAHFLEAVGVRGSRLELNSVGCPACRPAYREALRAALAEVREGLCADCVRRYETNPMRILDCKVEACRALVADVPVITDLLCDACATHLAGVEQGLQLLEVPYTINPHIVRGLDYYTRTAFEFIQDVGLGAQNTVLAGGRYDGLVAEMGGPATPAIGFAAGVERLLLAAGDGGPTLHLPAPTFVATLGDESRRRGFALTKALRLASVPAAMDYAGRGLKGQMKEAWRLGAWYTLILGDDELARGEVTLRDMRGGVQESVPLDGVVARLAAAYAAEPCAQERRQA